MSNLLASLVSSAGTMEAYGRVLETVQNNVANASTPGYAKQRTPLYALPFDTTNGTTGGVRAGELISARNEYAEQAVRRQMLALGSDQQMVNSLASLQSLFDISGNLGLPKAFNSLFESFSAWAATPTSQATRQTVLERATDVARNFQQTAAGLYGQARDAEKQIQQTVDHVNQLVGEIQGYNRQTLAGNKNDAGQDARIHTALEELSQLVDVSASYQPDGTVSVLLDGDTPVLIADQQYPITFGLYQQDTPPPVYPDAPEKARIVASDGTDMTAKTTGGQLGALLQTRNQILASYIGDSQQPGELNRMAKQFADRVNQLLTSGCTSDGPPPVMGVALFSYDTENDTAVAHTLSVDTSVPSDQLAAIQPGPPYVSNGIPLALAQLATPIDDADKIDGISYTEFYGHLASRIGAQLDDARNGQHVQEGVVAQAKNLRQQLSGVSLDEEATILLEFQRAYQANSRFITVLNQLTEEIINLLR